jgi:hypothetical protein
MTIQYVRDDAEPVMAGPILSTQTIAKGDLVALCVAAGNASLGVVRAQDIVWDSTLAQTQADFVGNVSYAFIGVAAQDLNNGSLTTQSFPYGDSSTTTGGDMIRVNTAGVYDMSCASSSTFTVGQRVGPAQSGGNSLLSQEVVGVAHDSIAIGRVVEPATAVGTVRVKIMSALLPSFNPGIAAK